jgi:hypothetical protein
MITVTKDGSLLKGEKGEKGDAGKDGQHGRDGKDGSPGPQGEPGKDGKDGSPGPQGEPGKDGRDGKDGAPGEKGEKGEKGDAGKDGAPGPQGPQGEVGPQGKEGPKGDDGEPGICESVAVDNSVSVSLATDSGVINIPNKVTHKLGSWNNVLRGQYTAEHFNMKSGEYAVQEDGKYSVNLILESLDVLKYNSMIIRLVLKVPNQSPVDYSTGLVYDKKITLTADFHAMAGDRFWISLENLSGKDISLLADKNRINSAMTIKRFA